MRAADGELGRTGLRRPLREVGSKLTHYPPPSDLDASTRGYLAPDLARRLKPARQTAGLGLRPAARRAGIPVRRYQSHGEKLHATVAVADDRRLIFGSASWSSGGFARNHEVDGEVLDSPPIAHELEAQVGADWQASSS